MNNHLKFIVKCFNYLKKKIFFLNIRNKNIQNSAYNQLCYSKLKRKYNKIISNYEPEKPTIKKSDKVWICWLQGMENAPQIVKKCYESVQKNIKNKEIIIITNDNYNNYIKFPKYIQEKIEKGIIGSAHFSDLIRIELLKKYGGLWIDSTVYVTEKIDESFFENNLFVYKELSLYTREELPIRASNWLIYSKTNNNSIISLTEKLLLEYWKKHNFPTNYFFFHLFFGMASRKYEDEWNKIPTFSNINPHMLQFELTKKFDTERFNQIKSMSKFHKLNHRIVSNDENSFYYHIINKM